MQDLQLLDAIERFLRGEMSPEEMASFEQLRKSNPEVDEKVVEHTMFLQQMDQFCDWKNLKTTLNDVHNHLARIGRYQRSPQSHRYSDLAQIQTGYGSCRLYRRYYHPAYCQYGHLP